MDTQAIRDAIKRAVQMCVGVTDFAADTRVAWEDDDAACGWREFPSIDLLETSLDTVGVDETREEYDEDADALYHRQSGLRQFVVQIKASSDNTCDASVSAVQAIHNIRLRLRRPSIVVVLQLANIAVVRFGTTTAIRTSTEDNRVVDIRVMDVTLSTSDVDEVDPGEGQSDYFDKVETPEPENIVY